METVGTMLEILAVILLWFAALILALDNCTCQSDRVSKVANKVASDRQDILAGKWEGK